MLDSWGSDVIVGLFALLFGGTLRVFMLFAPPTEVTHEAAQRQRLRSRRREGETWWQAVRRQAESPPDEIGVSTMPRSFLFATLAVYGMLAVIVVSIAISPIEMRWLAFVAGVVLGYAILAIVFHFAKRSAAAPPQSSAAPS